MDVMHFFEELPVKVSEIADEKAFLPQFPNTQLHIRRFDRLHAQASGNKLFKLYAFRKQLAERNTWLSFGGAHSNHLLGLATLGAQFRRRTIGVIRGEHYPASHPWLSWLQKQGMELVYVSPAQFRHYRRRPEEIRNTLACNDVCIIPEGGASFLSMQACGLMLRNSDADKTIVVPAGTGTTAAGLAIQNRAQNILAVQVLKGDRVLEDIWDEYGFKPMGHDSLMIEKSFHQGGYARWNDALEKFKQAWEIQNNVPLDRIYGFKALFALQELLKKGKLGVEKKFVYLHTGGLFDPSA